MKTPALDLWRRELAAKQRTADTFDALWRAACREQLAVEHAAMGLPGIAEGYRLEASRIVRDAARGKVA